MASKDQDFHQSGPKDDIRIDWKNPHHVRLVVACLVKGVYVLEQDRQGKREGPHACAPFWWKTFGFQLKRIVDEETRSSIFGAIFEYKPPPSSCDHLADGPRFVVAFRGTLIKAESVIGDMKLNAQIILNRLHSSSRCETAMQAVEDWVENFGASRVWLAGHSQGSAIALQVGKNMAKKKLLLESFLFNPPFVSALIEKIKSKICKVATQLITSGFTAAVALLKQSPEQLQQAAHSFAALSPWVPHLFVNQADHVCSAYIGYFQLGNWMQKFKLGAVHKIACRYSVILLLTSKNGTQAEPLHLIPSADLIINTKPPKEFMRAHGISEWWKLDLNLKSEVYKYNN